MPVIHVEMYEGRTPAQKKELAEAFTREMHRVVGCPTEQLYTIFHDVAPGNWAVGNELGEESP